MARVCILICAAVLFLLLLGIGGCLVVLLWPFGSHKSARITGELEMNKTSRRPEEHIAEMKTKNFTVLEQYCVDLECFRIVDEIPVSAHGNLPVQRYLQNTEDLDEKLAIFDLDGHGENPFATFTANWSIEPEPVLVDQKFIAMILLSIASKSSSEYRDHDTKMLQIGDSTINTAVFVDRLYPEINQTMLRLHRAVEHLAGKWYNLTAKHNYHVVREEWKMYLCKTAEADEKFEVILLGDFSSAVELDDDRQMSCAKEALTSSGTIVITGTQAFDRSRLRNVFPTCYKFYTLRSPSKQRPKEVILCWKSMKHPVEVQALFAALKHNIEEMNYDMEPHYEEQVK